MNSIIIANLSIFLFEILKLAFKAPTTVIRSLIIKNCIENINRKLKLHRAIIIAKYVKLPIEVLEMLSIINVGILIVCVMDGINNVISGIRRTIYKKTKTDCQAIK